MYRAARSATIAPKPLKVHECLQGEPLFSYMLPQGEEVQIGHLYQE
jgi:hypothetical protein